MVKESPSTRQTRQSISKSMSASASPVVISTRSRTKSVDRLATALQQSNQITARLKSAESKSLSNSPLNERRLSRFSSTPISKSHTRAKTDSNTSSLKKANRQKIEKIESKRVKHHELDALKKVSLNELSIHQIYRH